MGFAIGGAGPGAAQGVADHYVLALSWSPTFCADKDPADEPLQCGLDADRRFIVHGLWPNTADDAPAFCRTRHQRPSRRTIRDMLDVMPDRGLVAHQWRKHGTCSGMSAQAYFETVRRAFERVNIPAGLSGLERAIAVRPAVLREAFQRVNDALPDDGIYVRCRRRDLIDVRICMSPSLDFVACPRVERQRCRSRQLTLQPPR